MPKTVRSISTSPKTDEQLEILKSKYGSYSNAIAIAVEKEYQALTGAAEEEARKQAEEEAELERKRELVRKIVEGK